MKLITSHLAVLLQAVAIAQLTIAIINLFLIRILHWQRELAGVPLLLRQVVQVHIWFISITLAIFGVMTWRFVNEMAGGIDPACQWLAAGIGFFWAVRTVLQVFYYSSTHWRGKLGRTLIHIALLFVYGGFAAVYLWAVLGRHASVQTP